MVTLVDDRSKNPPRSQRDVQAESVYIGMIASPYYLDGRSVPVVVHGHIIPA